jgi:thiol-disulfide isomerase/thioredoxin
MRSIENFLYYFFSITMINYLTSSFLYTKLANLILWFYSDIKLGVGYSVIFILFALILPEPTYSGPNSVVYFNTQNSLDEEMERDKRVVWIVAFYTTWNPSCVNFAPIFAQLSNEYALENFKFGKVDIGRLPDVGKKYHVSDSSLSRQLPTVILFKNAKEVSRRPYADAKGKLVKFFFSEDNMRAAFDMNNIFKECKENPLPSKKEKLSDKKTK